MTGLMTASLDHAMWFHRPFSFDEWILFEQDSPASGGARGFNRGTMYTEQGVLVASVAQEGLIRDVAEKVCLIGLNRWDNPLQFANQARFLFPVQKRPNSSSSPCDLIDTWQALHGWLAGLTTNCAQNLMN